MILCVCGRYEICDKVIFLCHFNNVIHSLFQIFIKELVKFYAITSMARRTLKFIHSITISTTISTKMGCWVAELLGWKTPDLRFFNVAVKYSHHSHTERKLCVRQACTHIPFFNVAVKYFTNLAKCYTAPHHYLLHQRIDSALDHVENAKRG